MRNELSGGWKTDIFNTTLRFLQVFRVILQRLYDRALEGRPVGESIQNR